MKKIVMIFPVFLVFVMFISSSMADMGEVPRDMGEVQIVLTPATAGEVEYTYILQCTYMGNNHYSLCGKATHFFSYILDGKDMPPGFFHTKVVHGNAEIVDDEIIVNLQEVYPADELLIAEGMKELNSAAVRIVLNIGVLLDKEAPVTWTGTYTAIETRYSYPGVILDSSDRAASFFYWNFIEGTSEATIPVP